MIELNSHAIFPNHTRNAAFGAQWRFPTYELQTDVHGRALRKHAGTPHQQAVYAHIHRAALHFLAARLDQHFTANRHTMKATPLVLDLAPRGADYPQHSLAVDRLEQEKIGSRRESARQYSPVIFTGNHDNKRLLVESCGADLPRQFDPVRRRHIDIQENGIEFLLL